MPRRLWTALALVVVALLTAAAPAHTGGVTDPLTLVDPLVGTDGNGHTFPGADVPFGMVQFSPVSVGGGGRSRCCGGRAVRRF